MLVLITIHMSVGVVMIYPKALANAAFVVHHIHSTTFVSVTTVGGKIIKLKYTPICRLLCLQDKAK